MSNYSHRKWLAAVTVHPGMWPWWYKKTKTDTNFTYLFLKVQNNIKEELITTEVRKGQSESL